MVTFAEVGDAARLVSCSDEQIRRYARRGQLRVAARTLRGVRLFTLDDLERFRAERKQSQKVKPARHE